MAHATQTFKQEKICKHSVRFDSEDKTALFSGLYLNREAAKKLLKVNKLDDLQEIEVTVRVK